MVRFFGSGHPVALGASSTRRQFPLTEHAPGPRARNLGKVIPIA
jgi:hypothetical protein